MLDTTQPQTNEVLTAIAKAMGAVHKIKKTGQNTHDNYSFASVDDFLAMVNPVCAEAGLMVAMDEAGIEDFTRKGKYGESAWMRVRYSITVLHSSGQSLPPVSRTVEVLRNGSQAYGSAQSYVLKQFLRCLLLIPTGDKDDADLQPTEAGTVDRPPSAKAETRRAPDAKPEAERVLTKAEGDAILAAIAERHDWMELDEYVAALGRGPMAFAVHHPKIKIAIAEKRAEFAKRDPVALGDQRVPEGTPFDEPAR